MHPTFYGMLYTRDIMSKLLILGNGFDLHCGLDSSYHHFFDCLMNDTKYSSVYEYLNDYGYQVTGSRTNLLWALLLSYHDENHKLLWKDIESIISSFLYKPTQDYSINLFDIVENMQSYYDNLKQDLTDRGNNGIKPMTKFLLMIYRGNALKDICSIEGTVDINKSKIVTNNIDDIVNCFLIDLHEIELSFVQYLKSIYNSNQLIHVEASNTFEKLLKVNLSNGISPEKRVSIITSAIHEANILSFNYTRLGQPNGVNFARYKNIHGTFIGNNDDIIFGIDSFDISPLESIFKFTKTYRVALLESNLSVNPDIFDGSISLNDIEELIIFGHSLNLQDYSYFYTIFNKCNINSSNIEINLYYTNYGNTNRAPENILRLQNLIRDYEVEFKKPKGLFHRMLLEGRIHIIKM